MARLSAIAKGSPRALGFCTLLALTPAPADAQPRPLRSCIVIHETGSREVWRSDAAACATRLPPASTFKIPHALIALETGVIAEDTAEKWDGTRHSATPSWDRDHTVISAMRPSVLWFFQRVAPRIGAARMHGWLERLRYGNADTSGEITQYWVNGTLRISPDEQVAFLRELYAGRMPIAIAHQRAIRGALEQKPGTVQNARGVHDMEGNWKGVSLNAKTGATTAADGQRVSWLVGALTAGGREHVFASAIWRDGPAADGIDSIDGARLAVRTFIARGLLRPARAQKQKNQKMDETAGNATSWPLLQGRVVLTCSVPNS